MKNFILLLVVLICLVAYVRTKQPETWNSWMVAIGAPGQLNPAAPVDVDVPPPDPNQPPPVIVPSVGGLIKNGNFVAGEGAWEGDGTADPSGKGMVVTLSQSAWTRVYQTFSDLGAQDSIQITYRLSPGFAASQDPADYTEISKRLHIPGFETYASLGILPGQFYGTIGDPKCNTIAMEVYAPRKGSTEVQEYHHTYPPIPGSGTTTFALAFPPGTGTVTLLTAYVTNR